MNIKCFNRRARREAWIMSNLFSVGRLSWNSLAGKLPYYSKDCQQFVARVKKYSYVGISYQKHISTECIAVC